MVTFVNSRIHYSTALSGTYYVQSILFFSFYVKLHEDSWPMGDSSFWSAEQ